MNGIDTSELPADPMDLRSSRPDSGRTRSFLGSLVLGVVVFAAGCGDAPLIPDAIYHNAKVITVDADFSEARAFAVQDGKFIAVGSETEIRALAGPGTRIEDLQGQVVVPGFGDNHIHIGSELQEWNGTYIRAVDEWIRDAETMEELQDALRQRAAELPEGEWVTGGLTRVHWPNQRAPNRWELDEAVPDRPVALTRGPHTAILNSRALEIVGITAETPNPPGGWIIRDEDGVPSGRVLEAARRLIDPYLPEQPRLDDEELLERYREQLQTLLSVGLTHLDVAGVRPGGLGLVQELYDRWGEELPRMTVEVRVRPGWDAYDDPAEGAEVSIQELEGLGFHTGFGNDRLKLGAVKMGADGGLSAPVFWTLEPYRDRPDFHGEQLIHEDAVYEVGKWAHDHGWQLGIHTIGDAAAVMAVEVLERILEESPRQDHRHFLHHVTAPPPDSTVEKMARLGIGVASHPSWMSALGGFAEEALDGERLQRQNPSRSLLEAGVWMSYGSDQLPYGPIFNIWSAVTREGWEGRVYGYEEEAINVEEALTLHTMGTAFQNFDEAVRGSIEEGKVADFVVLDGDPLTVEPGEIRNLQVERTVVGGRTVFERTGF